MESGGGKAVNREESVCWGVKMYGSIFANRKHDNEGISLMI